MPKSRLFTLNGYLSHKQIIDLKEIFSHMNIIYLKASPGIKKIKPFSAKWADKAVNHKMTSKKYK